MLITWLLFTLTDTAILAPTSEGLEFTLKVNNLDYTISTKKLDYTLPKEN